jgi:cobalt-zinc-cadmium efflux system protein
MDTDAVENHLASLTGVEAVHDLHVWSMSTTEVALTAHLIMPESGDLDRFHSELARDLRHRFGIGHATIQVEHGAISCALESEQVV